MRMTPITAILALFAITVFAVPTQAGGRSSSHYRAHHVHYHGCGHCYNNRCAKRRYHRTAHKHYRRHNPRHADPYAYRYEPRGYYPYYKSHYWVPAHRVHRKRRSFRAPRYYPAWGYYKRRYNHTCWHCRNHGGHPFYYW